MKYLITNKTEKNWQDKKFVEATLKDEDGNEFKVSAWHGEYEGKNEIDCELEKNTKGYWGFKKAKLDKPNFIKAKEAQMEQVMEKKNQSIGRFQDNKEWSIKVASTINKAVDLAIAEIKDIRTLNTLEEDIIKWRRFLWNNWNIDLEDTDPLTDKIL